MPKKREKNSNEYYLGVIRGLKSEIRQLKKQLKHYERREYNFENIPDEPEDPTQHENYEEVCTACGKGKLIEHVVAGRYFQSCDTCAFRTKAKKL